MKKIIMLIGAILATTCSFADTSSLGKNSPQLNALSSAWKSHQSIQPNQNDITIVYGGEDVASHRPTLVEHTSAA